MKSIVSSNTPNLLAELSSLASIWLPLTISQFIAHAELPIVNAGVARGPTYELSLAALNVAMSLAVAMESWIMMLLPTSTALSKTLQSFRMIRTLTLVLAVLLTALMLLLSLTPMFDLVVVHVMGIPLEVARLTRPALQILTLWPFAVAWRRLHQGILIRLGRTRIIVGATVVRIVVSGLTAFLGVQAADLPAAIVGSVGLIAAVITEAVVVFLVAAKAMSADLSWIDVNESSYLKPLDLLRFYAPLAVTSFLSYLTIPILSGGLGRAYRPIESLAVWPVVFGLVHALDAIGYPLQETTIAAIRTGIALVSIRGFALVIGLGAMSIASIFAFTGIGTLYFHSFSGLSKDFSQLAVIALRVMIAVPLLIGLQSVLRGRLVAINKTLIIQIGMMMNLILLIGCLIGGIVTNTVPGLYVAAAAYGIGLVAELALLGTRVYLLEKSNA